MSRTQTILKGTFILTITGLTTRFMGFFYRIFLSHNFGEEGVGLYQLIFPVYALGFSLTSAGIEIALSRCVAKYYASGNKKKARDLLYTSLLLTFLFSTLFTLILQKYSNVIAEQYLHNIYTAELLLILSYIFPFAAVHSCIVGYYLGLKQTKIPAVSQFLEQGVRIISVFLFYYLSTVMHYDFTISFAVLGLIIGEIASCMYCTKIISGKSLPVYFPKINASVFLANTKELIIFSAPLTTSRVLLNVLQSIEAISIPLSLEQYGMSAQNALSTYGVLTGMALPCILFPSAITNAVSTMLLPTVSEIQTLKNQSALKKIFQKSITYCSLLGILCCIFFLLFGSIAGKILFQSTLAGKFLITLAWMCPFLYTNTTLLSIINGIGKTFISLIINILNLSIRIAAVMFFIPVYGIYGYLLGLLISQVFTFLSGFIYLNIQLKAEVP